MSCPFVAGSGSASVIQRQCIAHSRLNSLSDDAELPRCLASDQEEACLQPSRAIPPTPATKWPLASNDQRPSDDLPAIRVGVHELRRRISKEDSMSLSIAGALPTGEGALLGGDDFVCNTSETLIAAIEKCLDNGLGTCLVIGDKRRFVGRISLNDIGKAVLEGALLNPTLDQHLATFAHRLHNDTPVENDVLRPVLDSSGKLIGIDIDRSSQHIQVARPDMTHQ